jgi:hypothetical protein
MIRGAVLDHQIDTLGPELLQIRLDEMDPIEYGPPLLAARTRRASKLHEGLEQRVALGGDLFHALRSEGARMQKRRGRGNCASRFAWLYSFSVVESAPG